MAEDVWSQCLAQYSDLQTEISHHAQELGAQCWVALVRLPGRCDVRLSFRTYGFSHFRHSDTYARNISNGERTVREHVEKRLPPPPHSTKGGGRRAVAPDTERKYAYPPAYVS